MLTHSLVQTEAVDAKLRQNEPYLLLYGINAGQNYDLFYMEENI